MAIIGNIIGEREGQHRHFPAASPSAPPPTRKLRDVARFPQKPPPQTSFKPPRVGGGSNLPLSHFAPPSPLYIYSPLLRYASKREKRPNSSTNYPSLKSKLNSRQIAHQEPQPHTLLRLPWSFSLNLSPYRASSASPPAASIR